MDRTASGWISGFIGMAIFSGSLPATRAAVTGFDPVFLTVARAAIAGMLGLGLLFVFRQKSPERRDLLPLAVIALGVVVGFPLLTALALQHMSSAHSVVFIGLLPLSTAIFGVLRGGERPRPAFWLFSLAGSALVAGYAMARGTGAVSAGDLLMLAAIVMCGLGYAEGGRLSRRLGGWQVISWALVMGAPLLAIPTLMVLLRGPIEAPAEAWATFAFLVLGPQFLAFFAWYRAMALIGIARTSQIQLMQIFVSLGVAAWWLGETLEPDIVFFALWVLAAVLVGQRARVRLQTVRQETCQ